MRHTIEARAWRTSLQQTARRPGRSALSGSNVSELEAAAEVGENPVDQSHVDRWRPVVEGLTVQVLELDDAKRSVRALGRRP